MSERREECPDRPWQTELLTVTFGLAVETFLNKFEKALKPFSKIAQIALKRVLDANGKSSAFIQFLYV